MPRFTSSTRVLKCMWQGWASDQVLRMAITGLPAHSSGAKPICMARERWPKARKSSGANQRALRSMAASLFLVLVVIACSPLLLAQRREALLAFRGPHLFRIVVFGHCRHAGGQHDPRQPGRGEDVDVG